MMLTILYPVGTMDTHRKLKQRESNAELFAAILPEVCLTVQYEFSAQYDFVVYAIFYSATMSEQRD